MTNKRLPETVEEAVQELLRWPWATDQQSVDLIRGMHEDELIELHFSLGLTIRNEFGLWGRNANLLTACGESDADEASGVILGALRDHLIRTATTHDIERANAAREAWLAEKSGGNR